ncbi:RRNA-processing protein EBP2 [Phytophthora cinnamomi]|uniref:RRNA-processing protein EBP2 n=1 Tax=Phytophthora cinnamomi TaxID=4785 RepID=UPI00355A308F|nr:RRNA-processing protein EBP2 [Phytophthora cinnamomi]
MARKSSGARKGRAVSALVRAEDAAEEEILETPALSSAAADASDAESDDEQDAEAEAEAEIERRLVAEAQAEADAAKREQGVYHREALLALVADSSVHDDLKREVAFYNNTLAAVRLAKDRLKAQGVAYKRPDDYFAEMLKSDAHMAKVKDKLIYEQKKISAVEGASLEAHRKVAKEIQAEKVKERNQQKKDTLEAVKQWKKRKGADKGGKLKDDDDGELDSIIGGKRKHAGADRDAANKKPRVNKAREAKNAKFGFGGKRRHAKSNTKESTNDMSSFPGARKARARAQSHTQKSGSAPARPRAPASATRVGGK